MNLNLNYEGFEESMVCRRELNGGIQYLFKFENGYGASVVKNSYGSYGHEKDLWELAVIYYTHDEDWDLTYNTEITDDVVGWQTDEEIRELLARIKAL